MKPTDEKTEKIWYELKKKNNNKLYRRAESDFIIIKVLQTFQTHQREMFFKKDIFTHSSIC